MRGRELPLRTRNRQVPDPDYRQHLTLDDLDEYGCLRISSGLWLIIVYLCRHVVLLLLGATSSLATFTYGQTGASYGVLYSDPWFLLASAPALPVLAAGLRRVPSAPEVIRVIWRAGGFLLMLAAALDLAILAILVVTTNVRIEVIHISQATLSAICLFLLVRSRRIKDTFAEFPSARDTPKG